MLFVCWAKLGFDVGNAAGLFFCFFYRKFQPMASAPDDSSTQLDLNLNLRV